MMRLRGSRWITPLLAAQPLLEILFEGPAGMRIDLRPDLPLVFEATST
jgi:hypothetical protein